MQASIRSTLISVLAFAASASAVPGCADKSRAVTALGINDFDFHSVIQTTEGIEAHGLGTVHFGVSNPALDFEITCSADSVIDFVWFFGFMTFTCTSPNGDASGTFSYDFASGQVSVNETWVCADDGSSFTAEASIDLNLNCNTVVTKTIDPDSGLEHETTTDTCDIISVSAPASVTESGPPGLRTRDLSCSEQSQALTQLQVLGFEFVGSTLQSTPSHVIDDGTVAFNISNPALGTQIFCAALSDRLEFFFYGDLIYSCDSIDGIEASFRYSYPTGELSINQTWPCSDDGSHFFTSASVILPSTTCKEDKGTNPDWQPNDGSLYSWDIITCDYPPTSAPINTITEVE